MWKILLCCVLCLISDLDVVKNEQIRVPLMRQKTLREQIERMPNLKKFGLDFEWLHKPHKHKQTNDTIALLRNLDAEFYSIVKIGSQTFKMLFDTAWYTSWVISSECRWYTLGCASHQQYNHKKSPTYKPNGTKFFANEGSYNLTGFYSNDTFIIGNTTVPGQLFVEMTYVPTSYYSQKSDGLMALGFKDQFNPFIYNMKKNKTIDKLLFTIYINRDQESNSAGEISLGFIDDKHIYKNVIPGTNRTYSENITYVPVNPSQGYWQIQLERIMVNKTSQNMTNVFCKEGCSAIIDSTANSIIGPKDEIDNINKLIGANGRSMGRNSIKCSKVDSLPPIHFFLGGKNFTIYATNYIYKTSTFASTKCISAFVAPEAPTEEGMWILGGAFLSQFYSIYDIEEYKIGFVTAA